MTADPPRPDPMPLPEAAAVTPPSSTTVPPDPPALLGGAPAAWTAATAAPEPSPLRSPATRLEPARLLQPKPRPSRRARHPVVMVGSAIMTAVLFLSLGAGYAVLVGKQRFAAPGPSSSERIVNIPARSGVREIADLLQREGVIDQPWVFFAGVVLLNARDDLKAGEYRFPAHASLRDVVDTMKEGKVVQHHLTIPEGLTSQQVVARLLEHPDLAGTLKEIPKEGSLLPETYSYVRGTTRETLVQRMQQSQRKVLQEAWEKRSPDLPLKSPEQLLVLASIVEKETGKPDERARVAAVFVNRLRQRMRLESDPTIIYGLVGGKGTLGRPIMRSEIRQPTPYNTYVIDGLPPAPIANPGRAAIEATANPARTKELYFVADGTGGHTFSETLADHQRSVTRWRQLEQQAREGGTAGQDSPTPPAPPQSAPTAPSTANEPASSGGGPPPSASAAPPAPASATPPAAAGGAASPSPGVRSIPTRGNAPAPSTGRNAPRAAQDTSPSRPTRQQ